MLITGDMIISGFVSKAVNDYVDKKKDANKDRESNKQSKETRTYQVTIDALNEFTKNKYDGQDVLFDAAESLLNGFKDNQDDKVEAVRAGLKMLVSQVTADTCRDFLKILNHEICKDKNTVLYKEIVMAWQEQTNGNIQGGFVKNNQNHKETHEKLDYVKEGIDFIKENINSRESGKIESAGEIPIKNRAEEYAEKWNKNVFLNDFNKRDKKAGVNIKLSDLYLDKHLPHYIWGTNDTEYTDIEELLKEYTVYNDDKKMLLVLGQPGIGKSTLITWIMANLIERKDDIYVYQFASDLKDIDWQGKGILGDILKTLDLRYDELENKILILDGLDEIYASSGREKILNQIYHKLKVKNYLRRFSLVVTCRKNYISKLKKLKCDYITLQTWGNRQINSFCEIYGRISKSQISQNTINKILENKEVFGIPLILYMTLALNISIEENASIVDVYDQIFSLDSGGIYDRCINNLSYGEEHRISQIKNQIHQISQRIAFWIFENNAEKEFIPQKEYENICQIVVGEMKEKSQDIKKDVFLGNYFEPIKHCEGIGTDELHFVHRSIYEYYVADYFFECINGLTSQEDIAGKLGELLKDGQLSEQLLEFIKYKFEKIKTNNLSVSVKNIFQIMLRDGMAYHIGKPLLNIINREMNIFANMLEVVHLCNNDLGEVDDKIITYLQYNKQSVNLSGIKLEGIQICGSYLQETNLHNSYLKDIDLTGASLLLANLTHAHLIRVNLTQADLRAADITGIELKEVKLKETIFDEQQVEFLQKEYDLRGSKVYLSKTRESIDYIEYCNRK